MSFADALAEEMSDARKGPPCSIGSLVDRLDPDDWRGLCDSLATPSIPTARIAGALRRKGIRTTPQTVGRHRAGICQCRPMAAE